jgi:hypothetical protein
MNQDHNQNYWKDGLISLALLTALGFGVTMSADSRVSTSGSMKAMLLLVGGVGGFGFVANRLNDVIAARDAADDYDPVEMQKRRLEQSAAIEAHAVVARVTAERDAEHMVMQRMGIQPQQLPAGVVPVMASADPQVETEPVKQIEQTEPVKPMVSDPANVLYDRMWNGRKRHLLIPAETGAGKTSLFLGAVKFFNEKDPRTEFLISTCKPGPFLGLEEKTASDGQKVVEMKLDDTQTIERLIQRLDAVRHELVKRQELRSSCEKSGREYNPSRLIVVIDEWNTALIIAEQYTKKMKFQWSSMSAEEKQGIELHDYLQELKDHIVSILVLGREDEVAIWLMGQDHQVQNAGINTGLMKNFGIVVPVRMEAQQAAEDALTGRSPVLPLSTGKKILAELRETLQASPENSFAYLNIRGHEILPVPYLPNIKRDRCFAPNTSDTDDNYSEWN